MIFTANCLDSMIEEMYEKVKAGDDSLVKDVHAIVSGLKAFYTWAACDGMEDVR